MKLQELATVIRSKNAGPFFITFDVMFADKETYEKVKKTGVLNKKLFSKIYKVSIDKIQFFDFSPAYAFKWTIPRPKSCGEIGDSDIYGAQQHGPLMHVDIPL